jgi:hypothetical protein
MTRRLAWSLFAVALVLAPAAVVLAVIGEARGLELPPGRESELAVELWLSGVGVLYAAVGLVITRAQPRNAIGWIFLAAAPLLALTSTAYGYADLALYGGESWRGGAWAGWMASWLLIVPVFVGPCLIAQLFPSGQPLPGRRWRAVARLSVACGCYVALAPALDPGRLGSYPDVENPAGLPRAVGAVIVDPTWGVAIVALFTLSIASIVTRFRRSRGVERQQLRWLAVSGGAAIAALLVTLTLANGAGGALGVAVEALAFVAIASMPVAVAVAILRYRLYEIDRIVSRTLVYGSLTVILGAAYIGLVLAGQAVFSSFAGGSNLAIAISTLAVAALFLPVRSRIQRFVDRRFYRRRYDAQRTLEAFAARLREEVDLGALSTELRGVVEETMQPAHVSLWVLRGRS